MFSAIVAMTREAQVMGKNNALPWHLPGDLKFFKETTLGHRIIMGRKTFDSIGSRPLPKRENWVLSSQSADLPSVSFFKTKNEIIEEVLNLRAVTPEKKNFIIGGAKVFELFWPEINEVFVTWIDKAFDGDIVFPSLNWDSFHCLSERREIEPLPHTFCHYMRKS